MNESIAWREDGAEENPATHVTTRGKEIPIWKMSDRHLLNVLRDIERRTDGGMVIELEVYSDTNTNYADRVSEKDALKRFNYHLYAEEAWARGFPTKY